MLRPRLRVAFASKLRFVQFLALDVISRFHSFISRQIARRRFRWFAFIAARHSLAHRIFSCTTHVGQEEFSTLRPASPVTKASTAPTSTTRWATTTTISQRRPTIQVIPLNEDSEVEPATTVASQSTIVIERWLRRKSNPRQIHAFHPISTSLLNYQRGKSK